ncbi:MAG: IclR family transcriptional regulator domain-containing protein [Planctomycetota bacterium]|jgi:DNA-binding IclR family transcriptional regulator
MPSKQKPSDAPALQRGIDIINLVAQNPDISLAQLEEELSIPKASMMRLISTLTDNGYLKAGTHKKSFRLGDSLINEVFTSHNRDKTISLLRPMLKRLSKKWDATFVIFKFLPGYKVLWYVKEESEVSIRTKEPGAVSENINNNAQGKYFLSTLDDEELNNYLDSYTPRKSTEFTVWEKDKLLKQIAEIRKTGFAAQSQENTLTNQQIAVPVKIPGEKEPDCLTAYLNIDFDKLDELKKDMLFESSCLEEKE